ncbi:hypothetical protein ACJIZ3_007600 [Penstemon smallii]|uniref:Uncharacterized protein n=1 Tax=Penstemon smallii TaxID=265156 RepID=A0ABD3T7F3_9LAMI
MKEENPQISSARPSSKRKGTDGCVSEGRWECPICSANDECQPIEDESMDVVDKPMSNMNESEASSGQNEPNLSVEASTSVATKRKNNVSSHNSAKKRRTN